MRGRTLGVDTLMWTRTSRVTGELGSEIGSVPRNIACDITPVDSAGGHCYWGSAKPCERRARSQDRGPAHGSVTRSQSTLESGTTSGN